ncbi:MAG: crossover junction endodeoxyribonuclease RuvC [Spirochaetes bacterium]|nr:crossover junction endodeoxyribonuclease RuvC [Spirochaetota bacterium]
MIILGIDPGYAITGWAVFSTEGDETHVLDYGAIQIEKKDLYKRMDEICSGVETVIKKYKVEQAAIEKIFFNKNIKTAMDVAQVRGAIAITLLKRKISLFDYTPLQVKQALVGYGRAEKVQIQNMVKLLLGLEEIPRPDDIADALAIGICHINSMKFNKHVKESL